MTEQEYIDVTDLVKLRDIKFILRDIIPENSEIIDKDSFKGEEMKIICDNAKDCGIKDCNHNISHEEVVDWCEEDECASTKKIVKCIPVKEKEIKINVICNQFEKGCNKDCEYFSSKIICNPIKSTDIVSKVKSFEPIKVVDYKVIKYINQRDLENVVMKHVNDGWKLQGGFSSSSDGDGIEYYCQAVVKYG